VLSIGEARRRVLQAVDPLEAQDVAVGDAGGRVLASDVRAAADVPGFESCAMDGFAVRAGPGERELLIAGESRAGHPTDRTLAEGEAIRVSTGAVVPTGADAVVRVEDTTESEGAVTLRVAVPPGANIRRPGEDLRSGTVVVEAGRRLDAAALGVAVGAGAGVLRCARRPRVAVLCTGDELRPAGATLGPGEIHNSNAHTLRALVEETGGETTAATIVPDDPAGTASALRVALRGSDVVLVSGGVSVGDHDHVKAALDALGARERFWRVALQPGGPTWFGTREATLVFGLPGNPVSSMVTFTLFARPALLALQGADAQPRTAHAVLQAELPRRGNREQAVRVGLSTAADGRLEATPTRPGQGSHVLSSMLGADALALIAPGDGVAAPGEVVELVLL
jgi:molybdopterin molybdotransferase